MKSWDDNMQARAVDEGWRLADVVDNGACHVYRSVTPATTRFRGAYHALVFVIDQARAGSPLHQRALQIMSMSRASAKPPPKAKR